MLTDHFLLPCILFKTALMKCIWQQFTLLTTVLSGKKPFNLNEYKLRCHDCLITVYELVCNYYNSLCIVSIQIMQLITGSSLTNATVWAAKELMPFFLPLNLNELNELLMRKRTFLGGQFDRIKLLNQYILIKR